MIRKLLEHVSRERVLRRTLPPPFAGTPIYVTPDSALSYWRRDLSGLGRELFDFAEHVVRPGQEVWDVGANVGLFSVAAAESTGNHGRVTAFEPDLFLVSLLRRTARRSYAGERRLEVLPVAVGRELDLLEFHIANRGRSSSHLDLVSGNSQSGGTRERLPVPTLTLDWLLQRRTAPDVVKIDVEGAEVEVLSGASELLRSARPVLLCEVGERKAGPIGELLASADYRLFDWERRSSQPVRDAPFSTLALPSEVDLASLLGGEDGLARAGFR